MAHQTVEDCLEAAEFSTGEIREVSIIDMDIRESRSCPECGREYEYVYEYQGVWDTEKEKYVDEIPADVSWGEPQNDGVNYIQESRGDSSLERSYIIARFYDPDDVEHSL